MVASIGLWSNFAMNLAVEVGVKSFASVNNGKEFSLYVCVT